MLIYNEREDTMDKDRLKLIYKNLKSLLNALESEIYSDTESYLHKGEIFDDPAHYYSTDDDDGYTD